MTKGDRVFSSPDHFDVGYGIASASLTHGDNIIATTAADYHGISLVASATLATIAVYDNISTGSGNLIELFTVATAVSTQIREEIPIHAKNGIVVSITGAGSIGAIRYGPKG